MRSMGGTELHPSGRVPSGTEPGTELHRQLQLAADEDIETKIRGTETPAHQRGTEGPLPEGMGQTARAGK